MIYSFTWNGVNCRDMGIRLQNMPEIVRPEERVGHVVIPGRAGDLTITEGDDIYNPYIQTIPMTVYTETAVRQAEAWLRGDGYVTFCGQPDLKQRARVINAVNFRKHSKNIDWWDGEVQFYCAPLKEQLNESAVEITSSGATITNPGDVTSRPRITVAGSGDITIRIRSKAIALYGAESGWKVDSDPQWVTNSSGKPMASVYAGDFPILPPGESTVSFTGSVSKLTIEGRWRYL